VLSAFGADPAGGVTRLALSQADGQARRQLTAWMDELGLEITVDDVGNIFGVRAGRDSCDPVMTGSHLDTVNRGGRFDGVLGLAAALEALAALEGAGIVTRKPLAVACFTNEEGVRFAPDMMGSLVFSEALGSKAARATCDADGVSVGQALAALNLATVSDAEPPHPSFFVELHVEQGPVLDHDRITIGAVDEVTGISWYEIAIEGEANHAGTTPMERRSDAGFAAAAVITFLRSLALDLGNGQRATCGRLLLDPGASNVIAGRATLVADLRNTETWVLDEAESRLMGFLGDLEASEGVNVRTRRLVRVDPVTFDPVLVGVIEETARDLGLPVRRIASGAGHDAQIMAGVCPSAMIFVPSVGGISHSPQELTRREHLVAGSEVLLHTLLKLAS